MTEPARQIVAIGGADLKTEDVDIALYRYLLRLTGRDHPRVCFIPTASGEAQEYIVAFYALFSRLETTPAHLSLFSPPTADLRGFLLAQELVFVGGGNTRSMLALWREWGLDAILREAWERGIVLAGVSAGSICWFEQGITDSIPGALTPLNCLGFLPGSNCPHFDGEPERRPAFHQLLREGRIRPGYSADDGVGLHFVGERLERVVASRVGARAYRLELAGEAVAETPIEPERLETASDCTSSAAG